MALIRPLNRIAPKIGEDTFIAETAAIIGDVEIGDNCSIWYGAVLRGDVNS
ncbi:MAG TPA: gamma carbonic anhydrase family protein, partial [Tenuifilaceae bacterium]|nr:gamma carbonic anhydrase family protein [Tenuifilaceae bacterium]